MPLTPRFQLEYPADEQDPWYGPFEALVLNIDQTMYAQLERQNVILVFSLSPTLNTTTDTFSWTGDIELIAAACGRIATVLPGGIALKDGEFLYVDLPRPMTSGSVVTMKKATALGVDSRRQLVGVRRGTKVFFVNNTAISGSP